MIYGSVCSGIEAATVAWEPLGWKAAWYSEIEKFPCKVLQHHYPNVPNLGDMTKLYADQHFRDTKIDLLVGGTPCQSFSVAGLRKGLDDTRGNLALEFLRLVDIKRPRWFVWENVPGVLSSSGGRDFGSFLGAVQKLSYGFAVRILDAQYFGVPQRRRRVFVVGYLGDWRPAAAVLFERESLCGDTKTGRKKRQDVAPTIAARTKGGGGLGTDFDFDCDGGLIPFDTTQITSALNYSHPKVGDKCHPLASGEHPPAIAGFTPNSFGGYHEGCRTLRDNGGDLGGGSETLISTFDRQSSGEYGDDTVASTVSSRDYKSATDLVCVTGTRNHALKADGFDASEDGTGRGQPIIVVEQNTPCSTPDMVSLRSGKTPNQAICFSSKDYGADAGDTALTLRAGGHTTSHANAGVMPAVCIGIDEEQNATVNSFGCLKSREKGGGFEGSVATFGVSGCETPKVSENLNPNLRSERQGFVSHRSQVRRLTPKECERLQGFPDDFTLLPGNKADGPRYKSLGNSMAVPVMRWIGRRIQMVEEIING